MTHCKLMSLSHFSEEVIASWHGAITKWLRVLVLFNFSQKFKSRMMISNCDGSKVFSVQQVSMSQWNLPCFPGISYTTKFREISIIGGMEIILHFPHFYSEFHCPILFAPQFYSPFYSVSNPHYFTGQYFLLQNFR